GYRPALLRRDNSFVIPVGPLDQPDPHRGTTLLCPAGQGFEVRQAVAQVRLNGDADVGPVAEFLLFENFTEYPQGKVLVRQLLHVHVDEDVRAPGGEQDRPQPRPNGPARALRIQRIKLAVKRRKLYRNVDARQGPLMVPVDQVDGLPGVHVPAQALDQVKVFRLVAFRFRLGDGRLPKQAHRKGQRPAPQTGDGPQGLLQVGTSNETP